MKHLLKAGLFCTFLCLLSPAACIAADTGVATTDADNPTGDASVPLEAKVLVGGRQLLLNGAGIVRRWAFKVYAVALYLPGPSRSVQEVLRGEGARRLSILVLRDISARDFQEALNAPLPSHCSEADRILLQERLPRLSRAFAQQGDGLRKGDLLTLDWLPGRGTVIQINQRPLMEPTQGLAFYQALLGIWLGEQSADPDLKARLLGQGAERRS